MPYIFVAAGSAPAWLTAVSTGEGGRVFLDRVLRVDQAVVRRDQVLDASLDGTADICIMPAVSGGMESPLS